MLIKGLKILFEWLPLVMGLVITWTISQREDLSISLRLILVFLSAITTILGEATISISKIQKHLERGNKNG